MIFIEKLKSQIKEKQSLIIGGIDPRPALIPQCFKEKNKESECKLILDFYQEALKATLPFIVGVKLNIAFFERLGIEGLKTFKEIINLSHSLKLAVIADIKRGDISSSAEAYADAFLGKINFNEPSPFNVDAVTVNPYLGFDTLEPFAKACASTGKGMFVLVRTSNPGARLIQDAVVNESKTVSLAVAEWVKSKDTLAADREGSSGIGAVLGATYLEELKSFSSLMDRNVILIPGVGAQGASLKEVVKAIPKRVGATVINISRALFSRAEYKELSLSKLKEELTHTAKVFAQETKDTAVR